MNTYSKPQNNCDYASFEDVGRILGFSTQSPGWPDCFGNAIKLYLEKQNYKPIKTLSLFSGAGGLDIGFTDLGFEIVESVEIEKQFCDTLRKNTGEGKYFNDSFVNCIDIRNYEPINFSDIDWIIGGPPCQTFSAAGRRVSGVLGTNDARGTLFKEYVRLLKQINPRGFLFENVFGIVGAQNGKPWREIQQSFKDAGYTLFYRILDAADYGVPQHRERLIIIGLKNGTFTFPRPTHGPDSRNKTPFYNSGLAISQVKSEESIEKCFIKGRYQTLLRDIPPGLNYSYYTEEMGHPKPIFAWRSKFSDFMYKADPKEPVRTITATGRQYTGPLHWDNRYFTCEEYKRLQSFPDSYDICGAKPVVIKQIGNSVPPQLARMLAMSIRKQVFNTVFPFPIETIDDTFEMSYKHRKRELSKHYREEAMAKLKALDCGHVTISTRSNYYLSFSERFDFLKSDTNGTYKVQSIWNKTKLTIEICDSDKTDGNDYLVSIKPRNKWVLPVKIITLHATSKDWGGICAAWRVLDHEIIFHNLKADIIQLNGYYLYDSELVCEFHHGCIEYERVLQSLFAGECTQKIVTTQDLANIWGCDNCDVLQIAQYIKKWGFDIRNNNTNPQMGKDEWLIPYKFPSLVSQSVQLYKSL